MANDTTTAQTNSTSTNNTTSNPNTTINKDVQLIGALGPLLTSFFAALNGTIAASSKAQVEVGESKSKHSLLMAQERHSQEQSLLKADPEYAKSRMDQRYQLEQDAQKFNQDTAANQQKFDNEMTSKDFEFAKETTRAVGAFFKDLAQQLIPVVLAEQANSHATTTSRLEAQEKLEAAEELRRSERHAVEMKREAVRLQEDTIRAASREVELKRDMLRLEKDMAEFKPAAKVQGHDPIKEAMKSR